MKKRFDHKLGLKIQQKEQNSRIVQNVTNEQKIATRTFSKSASDRFLLACATHFSESVYGKRIFLKKGYGCVTADQQLSLQLTEASCTLWNIMDSGVNKKNCIQERGLAMISEV